MTSPGSKGIDSLMLMKGVTHEFTHCVHLNIDYSPNNPRWLWEGVAMFEANWFLDPRETAIIRNRQYPQLASLNNGMEYELGYVIIEAIKDIWGFDAVINLIKKRGDVQAVLNLTEKDFEQKVFDQIYKKYGKKASKTKSVVTVPIVYFNNSNFLQGQRGKHDEVLPIVCGKIVNALSIVISEM
jgi:hypothetical protein